MNFGNVNAVLIAIAFFVPGFVASIVLGMTFRSRSRSVGDRTLQYLTLSCFNYGLWSWLIVPLIYMRWPEHHPYLAGALVVLIVFLSPLGLTLALIALVRKPTVQRFLSALGFNINRFIPTAWDFVFDRGEPTWVIVRLTDGSTVYGRFATESFAGDDPGERDLYIEAVFRLSESGEWQPVDDTRGILIKASQIATVEFSRFNSD